MRSSARWTSLIGAFVVALLLLVVIAVGRDISGLRLKAPHDDANRNRDSQVGHRDCRLP